MARISSGVSVDGVGLKSTIVGSTSISSALSLGSEETSSRSAGGTGVDEACFRRKGISTYIFAIFGAAVVVSAGGEGEEIGGGASLISRLIMSFGRPDEDEAEALGPVVGAAVEDWREGLLAQVV